MAKTTSFADAVRLAQSVTAAGVSMSAPLQHLLRANDLLSRPRAAEPPETAIVTAALDGTLDEKMLDKLLPTAALASISNAYRQDLGRSCGHTLLGEFHRQVANGGADAILDSLRGVFDKHAAQIAIARGLLKPESSAEMVIETGEPELVDAWKTLNTHLAVVAKIGAIAAQFGARPTAAFPQVEEYSLAENARVTDAALMCTDGPLVADSALFETPNTGHRSSPWARCPLKLHTIESARERYAGFAAEEHDRVNSGPQDGWIDPTTGETHWIPKPENPYRRAS